MVFNFPLNYYYKTLINIKWKNYRTFIREDTEPVIDRTVKCFNILLSLIDSLAKQDTILFTILWLSAM